MGTRELASLPFMGKGRTGVIGVLLGRRPFAYLNAVQGFSWDGLWLSCVLFAGRKVGQLLPDLAWIGKNGLYS